MKKFGWWVIVGFVLALAAPVWGQPDPGSTALYVERVDGAGRRGEVLFVAGDGALAAVPVPEGLYPAGYPDSIALGELALSRDGTKLAATFYPMGGGNMLPVVIADLTLGTCCVTLAPPLSAVYAYDLAGFNAAGTQFALSYVGDAAGGENPFAGGMLIAATATGVLDETVSMEEALAGIGAPGSAIWALMGDWTQDGIQWTPNCYACEGAFEGEFSLWAPQKDSFIARSGVGFSIFSDLLTTTRETLYAGQSPAYPVSPEPAMLPIPNVIQYLPGGVVASAATLPAAPVVFFDPATLDLGEGAHWVTNGTSFLVTPPNTGSWTLMDRVGGAQPMTVAEGARFLTGTQDGWLVAVPNGAQIDLVRFVSSAAGSFGAVIDRAQPRSDYHPGYIVLRQPVLGVGIPTTVPPVVPPSAAVIPTLPPAVATSVSPVVQCPGFLPSRLAAGQLARVTPGDPNNLRALPDVSAPLVGRMPGGAEFMVMTGPICDAAGMAWWQITYNGLIGWTAEGQGDTYFTEPLPAG